MDTCFGRICLLYGSNVHAVHAWNNCWNIGERIIGCILWDEIIIYCCLHYKTEWSNLYEYYWIEVVFITAKNSKIICLHCASGANATEINRRRTSTVDDANFCFGNFHYFWSIWKVLWHSKICLYSRRSWDRCMDMLPYCINMYAELFNYYYKILIALDVVAINVRLVCF